jgi:hypothetical protein
MTAFVLLALNGCQIGQENTLQQKIRKYLYDNQPTTAAEFIQFANRELKGYSSRQILKALHAEGQHQAELGHPSAVGVLSYFASGYAQTKGLSYDAEEWVALQQEALKRNTIKESPSSLWK